MNTASIHTGAFKSVRLLNYHPVYNIEKFAKNVIVFSGKAAKYNVAKPVDFHF